MELNNWEDEFDEKFLMVNANGDDSLLTQNEIKAYIKRLLRDQEDFYELEVIPEQHKIIRQAEKDRIIGLLEGMKKKHGEDTGMLELSHQWYEREGFNEALGQAIKAIKE